MNCPTKERSPVAPRHAEKIHIQLKSIPPSHAKTDNLEQMASSRV